MLDRLFVMLYIVAFLATPCIIAAAILNVRDRLKKESK